MFHGRSVRGQTVRSIATPKAKPKGKAKARPGGKPPKQVLHSVYCKHVQNIMRRVPTCVRCNSARGAFEHCAGEIDLV